MKKRIIATLSLLVALSGCHETYQVSGFNPTTGYFETDNSIETSERILHKKIETQKFSTLAVVALKKDGYLGYYFPNSIETKFWTTAIQKFHFFKTTISSEELANYVVNHGYEYDSSLLAYNFKYLHTLAKTMGDFLIIEIRPIANDLSNHLTFKVIDAKTNEPYFIISKEATNFAGLDSHLFYPILNAFKRWWLHNQPKPKSINLPARYE